MKLIQLHYLGNFRYLLFLVDEQYYLVDRRPSHLIGHFLLPLNWIFYHKVYPITIQEYHKIKEKHIRSSKFVIPISLVGGITVFLNAWMRVNNIDIFKHFNTDFSMRTNGILLVIGLVVAYFLLQLLYYYRKKNMESLLGRELKQLLYYKMRPEKILQFFLKLIGFQIFGIGLVMLFVVAFLYLGNIIMLLITILMTFIFLGMANGTLSDHDKWKYKIVDVLSSKGRDAY